MAPHHCNPQGNVAVAATFLAACLLPCLSAVGSEPLDPRRFLDSYRPALVRLQAACSRGYIEGVYTSQSFKPAEDNSSRQKPDPIIAYSSDGQHEKHILIRRDLSSSPYFERIFLPRNGRTLILERIDPARPFYIRWITKPTEPPDNLAPNDRRDTIVRAAYSIGDGLLIPSIIESPSFEIVEAARVKRDGDSLVRVVIKSGADAAKSLPALDGWLLLDPTRDFALRSHEVRILWPTDPKSFNIASGTVRYADRAAAGMLPEEVILVDRYGPDGEAGERRTHFRAQRRSTGAPAAAEFTLAHHDLGDFPWSAAVSSDVTQVKSRGANQLVVRTPVLHYDRPAPKQSVDLSFELSNSGTTPARIVGMRIGCAAVLPSDDLPCRIEPGQTKRLTVRLNASSQTGNTRTPLYLYTTAPGQAEIELTLVGRSAS